MGGVREKADPAPEPGPVAERVEPEDVDPSRREGHQAGADPQQAGWPSPRHPSGAFDQQRLPHRDLEVDTRQEGESTRERDRVAE